jgi:hypothetical protein
MKKELIDPVLDGYTTIIRDLLNNTDNRFRFDQIGRIARMAHELSQTISTRVSEFEDPEMEGIPGVLHVGRARGMTATDEIMREIISVFQPLAATYIQREQLNTQHAQEERQEERLARQEERLDGLFAIRAQLEAIGQPTDAIDQRINQLNAVIAGENDVDSCVVHPKLLRRYQVGDDQPALQSDYGEPDGAGVGGAQEAATDGDCQGLVGQEDEARMG